MKKKFLSLFTLIIIAVVAVALVACENYGDKDDDENGSTSDVTYKHTIKNGTFYASKTTATKTTGDAAVLDDLTNWTAKSGSLTTSYAKDQDTFNAVVDLGDADTFDDIVTNYLTMNIADKE